MNRSLFGLKKFHTTELFLISYIILMLFSLIAIDIIPSLKAFFTIKSIGLTPLIKVNSVLLALAVAPVFEEIIFRLPISGKINHLLITVPFATAFSLFYNSTFLYLLIVSYMVWLFFSSRKEYNGSYNSKILVSATFFALLHTVNYEYTTLWTYLLVAPILISPQFLLGLCAGLLRERNFFLALALHLLYNLSLIVVYYLT